VDDAAPAQDGDATREGKDFVQFVRNKDDAATFGGKLANRGEEFGRLGRGQDGGGLIEDKNAGLAAQGFQDFDALLCPDGKTACRGVPGDTPAETVSDGPGFLKGSGERVGERTAHFAGRAKEQVLRDSERRDKQEVLMHHPDTLPLGIGGGGEAYRPAVPQNLSAGGAEQAGQDVHQRGLTRAVLAEQGVDLAASHVEVYTLQCGKSAEPLGHPPRGKKRCLAS
jgi:hypothetical protein